MISDHIFSTFLLIEHRMMSNSCRSFQPPKLTVWGSVLLMACTYSVSMAEVTEADMPESNFDQPAQPVYLEIKDTPPPDQGESYPAQAESKPEPEAQPQAPQDPVADQQPATHEPERSKRRYFLISNRSC